MVKPEHRAVVVRKLRDAMTALALASMNGENVSDGEFIDMLAEAVMPHGWEGEAAFLAELADLIERKTTSWKPQDPDDVRPTYLCDVCKTPIGHMLWSYCPKCGAEIVR